MLAAQRGASCTSPREPASNDLRSKPYASQRVDGQRRIVNALGSVLRLQRSRRIYLCLGQQLLNMLSIASRS